jgi:hypothetical protein
METDFLKLFAGRGDIKGAVHGECVKEPITWSDVEAHLYGEGSLGIYPLVNGVKIGLDPDINYVHWGCSDIDVDDLALASRLAEALALLDINCWVERTKSKGYHVWVFTQEWVPADIMRRALLVAHHVADIPAKEVNPKQVEGKQYGNYVNLPYAAKWTAENRRVMVDPNGKSKPFDYFVLAATRTKVHNDALERAAALWKEPEKPQLEHREYEGQLDKLTTKLDGLAWTIFKEGPKDGRDRSTTLARLAHLCAERGLSVEECYAVVSDADCRWGKFADRADGEEQLWRICENAYHS